MALSRRRVLAFGIGGALLLTCGGVAGTLTSGYRLPAGDAPIGLTAQQLAVVRALVEALLPADGDLPAGIALGVHQRIDEECWSTSDALRSDLQSAISVIEYLPLVRGYGHRFTRLDLASREACFHEMLLRGPTPVIQAAVALKQMCSLFYYARPETWPAIGYGGPRVPAKPPESSIRYQELLMAAREAA